MRKRYIIAIWMVLGWLGGLGAQPCSEQSINEAIKKYEIGHFDEVFKLLRHCVKDGFNDQERMQAYKFLAYSYLAIDSIPQANESIAEMVRLNPNFEPDLFAPPRFVSLLTYFKEQGSRNLVTSVSKRKEDVYLAPASVMVITEEDIRRKGYTDLEEIFMDLPGFDVQHHFAQTYSNIYQRGYQSSNTERTLFLVDGIEENDLWSMLVYWGKQMPITNVKRVEVVYGPASTMYGANAFVGVVNVITKDPLETTRGNPVAVKASGGFGNYRHRYFDLTVAGQYKGVSAQATARRVGMRERDLSDFPEYDYSPDAYDAVNYANLTRLKTDVPEEAVAFLAQAEAAGNAHLFSPRLDDQGNVVGLRLSQAGVDYVRQADQGLVKNPLNGQQVVYSNAHEHWYFNGKIRVGDFLLGYESWHSENGIVNYDNDLTRAPFDNGGRWVPRQYAFYAKFDKNLSDRVNVSSLSSFRASFQEEESVIIDAIAFNTGGLRIGDVISGKQPYWRSRRFYQESRQFRQETKVAFSPISNLDIISGVEMRTSNIQGDYRLLDITTADGQAKETGVATLDKVAGGNNFVQFDFGTYAQASYRPVRGLSITLGARYDYNQIRSEGGYGSIINPRFAVVWSRNEAFILKAIYASAFQNASNFQKYGTSPGVRDLNNPTLQPEKVTNYEFTAIYRGIPKLHTEFSYYNSFYTGAVSTRSVKLPNGTNTTQFQALGERQIWGLQAAATYHVSLFDIFLNYTYANPRNNRLDAAGELTGELERIGEISAHQIKGGFMAKVAKHWNVCLKGRYMSRRPVGEGTTSPANTQGDFPAIFLLDGNIGYFDVIKGLDIQLIGNNLLNLDYSDPGVRNGSRGAYRTPQRLRNFTLRFIYAF